MSNHTHPKEKLNTGHCEASEAYIQRIVRQAERTKPSESWEWATDDEGLYFIKSVIKKHGSIEQDEM